VFQLRLGARGVFGGILGAPAAPEGRLWRALESKKWFQGGQTMGPLSQHWAIQGPRPSKKEPRGAKWGCQLGPTTKPNVVVIQLPQQSFDSEPFGVSFPLSLGTTSPHPRTCADQSPDAGLSKVVKDHVGVNWNLLESKRPDEFQQVGPRGPKRSAVEPNWFYMGRTSSKRQSGVKAEPKTIAMHPMCWAAEGRSGTLVWRAAKGCLYWIVLAGMAGGRRAPKTTRHLGGRPKVALACSLLILAPAVRKSTVSFQAF